MKIARVCSFFSPVEGGMETHLLEESKELAKLGHTVTVFTSDSLCEGKISQKKELIDHVTVERLPTWFRLSYFTPFFPGVYWKALTADYDILHVDSFRQPHNLTLLFAKLRGKKTVLGVHWPEYPKELRSSFLNLLISLFDRIFGKLILTCADTIIAQTKAEEAWLTTTFGRYNTVILPPGIAAHYLRQRSPTLFRKKYRIKGQMVLYIGRLHASKGVQQLLTIAPFFPKATFVLAGDGPLREQLQHQIRQQHLSNVLLVGRVSEEEKMQAYASCDVFAHPTHYDAFGITLLEAMAQGKPVLGSRVGGVPSVIGAAGLTFTAGDLGDLKKQLHRLLTNKKLRVTLGKRGRKKVEQMTWEHIAKQVDRVYRSL